MSNDKKNSENSEDSITVELVKSFAISAAITAGTLAGMIGVGYVVTKHKEFKENRLKKEQDEFDKKFEDIIKNNK